MEIHHKRNLFPENIMGLILSVIGNSYSYNLFKGGNTFLQLGEPGLSHGLDAEPHGFSFDLRGVGAV
jgi:hypothetical protein